MGAGSMNASSQAAYRLRLAEGFLGETRQDVKLKRWRSAMDNSQLAVENAAKSLLSLLAPVGRTHQPALLLRQSINDGRWKSEEIASVSRLTELAELLGFDVRIQTDYGDEAEGLTPWELFDEADALQALGIAEEAVRIAKDVLKS